METLPERKHKKRAVAIIAAARALIDEKNKSGYNELEDETANGRPARTRDPQHELAIHDT